MGAVLMVIADIVGEQPLQMGLIQRNHMIEKITSAALHPAFGNAVLPRALERSSNALHSHRTNGCGHLNSIFPVPVKDHKSGSRSIRKCFPQLLDDPKTGRMPRHVEMQDASTVMPDDEKAVKHAECDRRNREEIHCGYGLSMIT